MRKWFKYRVIFKDNASCGQEFDFSADPIVENTLNEAINSNAGKGHPIQEFFKNYKKSAVKLDRTKKYIASDKEAFSRLDIYRDFLFRKIMAREGNIFSIGSGACINELILAENGFDVTASDITDSPNRLLSSTGRPIKFFVFDACQDIPSELIGRYDYAIALGVFYLFDNAQLPRVFENCRKILKAGGELILDFGGARENTATWLIDEVLCKCESILRVLNNSLKRKKCAIQKTFHGFRRTDREIIAIAEKSGFSLKELFTADCVTELSKSVFLSCIFGMGAPCRLILRGIGKSIPYVRLFALKAA